MGVLKFESPNLSPKVNVGGPVSCWGRKGNSQVLCSCVLPFTVLVCSVYHYAVIPGVTENVLQTATDSFCLLLPVL